MKIGRSKVGIILFFFSIAAGTALLIYRSQYNISVESIKLSIESWGKYAPLIFIMLCIGRSIVFLPCGLFSVLGGILFGPLLGTAFVLSALTAGSVYTYYMAKHLGSRWTGHIMNNSIRRLDGLVSNNGFYGVFLMRAVPILPFDVVSCIAGMSGVRLVEYVSATFFGSIPGVFIYVYFGDSILSLSYKKIILSFIFIVMFAVTPQVYRFTVKILKKAV